MGHTQINVLMIVVFTLGILGSSCSPAMTPATPDAEALLRWAGSDEAGILQRFGHGTVYDMAVSPDGKTIAVTGLLSVSTYDFDSLQQIWTSVLVPSHPPVTTGRGQVTWSPDGSQLATLSEVGVTIWDARTGQQLQLFEGDTYTSIHILTWTQDNVPVAIDSRFGHVTVSEIRTGREVFNVDTGNATESLDVTQQGAILAVSSVDGNVASWDMNTNDPLYPAFRVCEDFCVYGIRTSPDANRLAIISPAEHDSISVWDLRTGEEIFSNEAHGNYSVTDIKWSPDNQYLAEGFNDGSIAIWNIETGELQQSLNHVANIIKVAWSADGSKLVALNQYQTLTTWDVKTGKQLRSLNQNTSWVLDAAWSPDGSMLAYGHESGEITIRDAYTGETVISLYDPTGWVGSLDWSPDGTRLASTGGRSIGTNTIKIWKVRNGKQLRTWPMDADIVAILGLEWSPDGSTLASLLYDGSVVFWNPDSGAEIGRLPAIRFSEDMVWSPDGALIATSYPRTDREGEQVTLWNPKTGEPVRTQQGKYSLAWSPVGDVAASISDNGTDYLRDDQTIVLWDPKTGNELRRFNTGIFISNIAWSPDGKFLIIGPDQELDRSLVILDSQTGQELRRLKGHYDAVTQIIWSPRGDLIASSAWDGTVILWGIADR